MKINKKISALFIGLIITFSQVSAGLDFSSFGSDSELYIINNATLLEGGNDVFEDYKEKHILDLKKTAEKWGLKSLDIKLPWGESLKYTIDSNNTGSLVQEVDKIVLVSDANGNITIYPPSNSPFKEKYQYSYIIPGIENKWFELGDSTTGEKTYNNMYNVTNKGKNIVFTIKDYYGNNTYITSKLGESTIDFENISNNFINDFYEESDDGKNSVQKPILDITKTITDGLTHEYLFTSKNTPESNVRINNFIINFIGDGLDVEILENTCDFNYILEGSNCKISYNINPSSHPKNIELFSDAIMQFEGQDYEGSIDLTPYDYLAPTSDGTYASIGEKAFYVPDATKIIWKDVDYSRFSHEKYLESQTEKGELKPNRLLGSSYGNCTYDDFIWEGRNDYYVVKGCNVGEYGDEGTLGTYSKRFRVDVQQHATHLDTDTEELGSCGQNYYVPSLSEWSDILHLDHVKGSWVNTDSGRDWVTDFYLASQNDELIESNPRSSSHPKLWKGRYTSANGGRTTSEMNTYKDENGYVGTIYSSPGRSYVYTNGSRRRGRTLCIR